MLRSIENKNRCLSLWSNAIFVTFLILMKRNTL